MNKKKIIINLKESVISGTVNYIEYKSNGDKNKNLLPDKYLNKTEPYLRNRIIDLQNFDAWKIQLTIAINFISSKDAEEEHVLHSRTNNIEFTS